MFTQPLKRGTHRKIECAWLFITNPDLYGGSAGGIRFSRFDETFMYRRQFWSSLVFLLFAIMHIHESDAKGPSNHKFRTYGLNFFRIYYFPWIFLVLFSIIKITVLCHINSYSGSKSWITLDIHCDMLKTQDDVAIDNKYRNIRRHIIIFCRRTITCTRNVKFFLSACTQAILDIGYKVCFNFLSSKTSDALTSKSI